MNRSETKLEGFDFQIFIKINCFDLLFKFKSNLSIQFEDPKSTIKFVENLHTL